MSEDHIFENLFDNSKDELSTYAKPKKQAQLKKQFNKLKHKILYLNMEHEELNEEFQEIRRDFIAKIMIYCQNNKIQSPLESSEEKNIDEKEKKSPSEINDLFRQVVIKTHPDKNKDLSEEELEERKNLFNEAVKGKDSGDFGKILQAALELNVSIKTVSPSLIKHLRKEIQKMQKNIKQIKNDIMYQWGKSDQKTKQQIFELLTKNLKPL